MNVSRDIQVHGPFYLRKALLGKEHGVVYEVYLGKHGKT